jgi:integrase
MVKAVDKRRLAFVGSLFEEMGFRQGERQNACPRQCRLSQLRSCGPCQECQGSAKVARQIFRPDHAARVYRGWNSSCPLSAVKAKKIARSPIFNIETTPKAKRKKEIVVLDEAKLGALLNHLKGHWLYLPSLVSAFTGMRRGEVLGLRWQDIDMGRETFQLVQQVKNLHGEVIIGALKSKRSCRPIKVPPDLIAELEKHRKEQLEQRLKIGLGGRPELVFTSPLGQPLNPETVSEAFTAKAVHVKPGLTFHCLRHTHITHLLRSGVPVHMVSARVGHAKPSITLDAYCHLLGGEDNDAARQAEAMLLRILK